MGDYSKHFVFPVAAIESESESDIYLSFVIWYKFYARDFVDLIKQPHSGVRNRSEIHTQG